MPRQLIAISVGWSNGENPSVGLDFAPYSLVAITVRVPQFSGIFEATVVGIRTMSHGGFSVTDATAKPSQINRSTTVAEQADFPGGRALSLKHS